MYKYRQSCGLTILPSSADKAAHDAGSNIHINNAGIFTIFSIIVIPENLLVELLPLRMLGRQIKAAE